MAHERRKLQLRGQLLQNRANIAKMQEKNKQIRAELGTLRQTRKSSSDSGLRAVKL
jgi:hypothetical protein